MEVSEKFNKSIIKTLKLSPSLMEWFERNQNTLVEYNLIKGGCIRWGNKDLPSDIQILSKMAGATLLWLEKGLISFDTKSKRAYEAAKCLSEIYKIEKDNLSEEAKVQYEYNFDYSEFKKKRLFK